VIEEWQTYRSVLFDDLPSTVKAMKASMLLCNTWPCIVASWTKAFLLATSGVGIQSFARVAPRRQKQKERTGSIGLY
jgi:hypothetical protein